MVTQPGKQVNARDRNVWITSEEIKRGEKVTRMKVRRTRIRITLGLATIMKWTFKKDVARATYTRNRARKLDNKDRNADQRAVSIA